MLVIIQYVGLGVGAREWKRMRNAVLYCYISDLGHSILKYTCFINIINVFLSILVFDIRPLFPNRFFNVVHINQFSASHFIKLYAVSVIEAIEPTILTYKTRISKFKFLHLIFKTGPVLMKNHHCVKHGTKSSSLYILYKFFNVCNRIFNHIQLS